MSRLQADLLLFACAVVWGLAFLFQKSATAYVGPFTFISARCLVAALVLAPLALIENRRSAKRASEGEGTNCLGLGWLSLGAGAAFLAAAGLQQTGLATATVTNAGFLTALYVVVTPFVSSILTRRPVAVRIWLAAVLSLAGTWFLSGASFDGLHGGDLLVAVSALFWAVHVVLTGFAAASQRPMMFTALQFLVVGVASAVIALLSEPITVAALASALPDILYVGILSTALAFSLFCIALRSTTPAEAAVILSSEMLFAAAAAQLLLGETLTASGKLGAAAIFIAVLVVQLPRLQRDKRLKRQT